jgi:pimeloyl-ACP methyl ester carboxylesterase
MSFIDLHYTEHGQGTPLVLLHGFPFSSALWRDQANGLADFCRVITPDLRGHGASPAPEGTYTMEILAQDVLRLLDSLGVEKAAIMGHSMGGYVALALWRLAPARFTAFGLIASHVWADTDEGRKGRYDLIAAVEERGTRAVVDAMLPRLFGPQLAEDEPIKESAESLMLATKPSGVMGALRGMALRSDSSDLLPLIDVPTLILCGDSDKIVPPARAESMAAALPNATLITIENAGHLPMLEQPHATTLALRTFLNDLDPYKKAERP